MKFLLLPSASRSGAFGTVADAFLAAAVPDSRENAKKIGPRAVLSCMYEPFLLRSLLLYALVL